MPFRLKRWQWVVAGLLFTGYAVLATFGVYGGFYIGYPPYTPAWLNATNETIERHFHLARPTRLHLWGELSAGRIVVSIDGREAATFAGRFDRGFTLASGERAVRLENEGSSGRVSFRLE